jgi:mono/diheme cytochrome c family protein
MKRITYISAIFILSIVTITSCDDVRRETGSIYMPDMAYSRAYESYGKRDSVKFTANLDNIGEGKIFYNNLPPAGTIKRGELFPYTLPNDSVGYKLSDAVKNPFDTIVMSKAQMGEAGRLFNVNCAICHGAKGAGNGPIAAAGHIGGVANLTTDAYIKMTDGMMFHSLTYGKNNMGSYASQITKEQRWMIVKYIRTLQPKPELAKTVKDSTTKKG